jgi:imidazoleglycerol-phosphate dehydratase
MDGARVGEVLRQTRETRVAVRLALDGPRAVSVRTGLGFLDHMLTALLFHWGVDAEVTAEGDLAVDAHHTVEDAGIALGMALAQALGGRAGVHRFGWALVPLDEALAQVALDLSGRGHLEWSGRWPPFPAGGLYPDLWPEFFRGLCRGGGVTLHVRLVQAQNGHHAAETVFKAVGLALAQATAPTGSGEVPSTKGVL